MSAQLDGWEQIGAGLTLIEYSKLAKWEPSNTGLAQPNDAVSSRGNGYYCKNGVWQGQWPTQD